MKFATISEGLTDFKVLNNLLIGFFSNKNLPVTRLIPKENEPVGWGNVLKYISSQEFRDSIDFSDCTIIQIDTDKCEEWQVGLKNIGDDVVEIKSFIDQVIQALINKIGSDFYNEHKGKIIFAICVHEIECWLLPFIANNPGHSKKIVLCANTVEFYAKKINKSIHQKNYENGKLYDDFSKEMKNNNTLMQKQEQNPSLKIFIESLKSIS